MAYSIDQILLVGEVSEEVRDHLTDAVLDKAFDNVRTVFLNQNAFQSLGKPFDKRLLFGEQGLVLLVSSQRNNVLHHVVAVHVKNEYVGTVYRLFKKIDLGKQALLSFLQSNSLCISVSRSSRACGIRSLYRTREFQGK